MAYVSNSMRCKREEILIKSYPFLTVHKTLTLALWRYRDTTGQGDPSSWTELTGTTEPLCPC